MRDLQRRLSAAGFLPALGAEAGRYCARTQEAVAAFQSARGLHATGTCDEHTWSTLVEAGWQLGDRLLHLRSPNLRGDDVAELQQLLGRLGFDCGRPDGIFGPLADAALREFQANCGLLPDGVCGHETIRALHALVRQSGTGPGITAVREAEALRTSRHGLVGRRIVVGQFGGLGALSRAVTRHLRARGAHVAQADEPDAHLQAMAANLYHADLYLGVESHPDAVCTISYFSVPAFSSIGGHSLARAIERAFVQHLARLAPLEDLPAPIEVVGMRLPVLRETRMPAVLCTLGPVRSVLDHAAVLADALVEAVAAWSTEPVPTDG